MTNYASRPDVVFTSITTLDPELVERAAYLAQFIALKNGNKTGPNLALRLITDDIKTVESRVPVNTSGHEHYLGLTWRRSNQGSFIWITPKYGENIQTPANYRDTVETLIHELAHAMTKTGHGWTWRRMYALLLTFISPMFVAEESAFDVRRYVHHTIQKYQRRGETTRTRDGDWNTTWAYERRDEELEKHLAAVKRMRKRLGTELH
jgi:hypothetical protein